MFFAAGLICTADNFFDNGIHIFGTFVVQIIQRAADAVSYTHLIYIGEAWIDGGQWSSYPPHKHDDMNMPTEANTEEIYYFEFEKPQGFGIQKVYTMEGNIDETYTVKSGDFVEIPRGYHPYHSAPGYKSLSLIHIYIHHMVEAYGNYSEILREFCKYVPELDFDPIEE